MNLILCQLDLVNQIMPQIQLQLEEVMQNAKIVLSNINTLFDEETKQSRKHRKKMIKPIIQ